MNKLTQRNARSANEKDRDQMSTFNVDSVKIVPLSRRNDDIYMRTLRRRRA